MKLNLLTFNTLGTPFFAPDIAKRYKKTAEIINDSDIDVVTFQEVFSHYNKLILDSAMKKFPYRVYKPFVLGLYGGLAIYSKLPIELESFHVYQYPRGLAIPFYTKLAHSGMLVAKFIDLPLRLITTHLSSDIVHNLTPQNRFYKLITTQLDQVEDLFTKLSAEEGLLMTGDFNISNDSELYESFRDRIKAQDLFAGDQSVSYAPDRIQYIYPAQTSKRIDYIFYKGHHPAKVIKKERMFIEQAQSSKGHPFYLSDHIGLFASINI